MTGPYALIMIIAIKIKVIKKGSKSTNQESEPYPLLHIKSKINVQNNM